MSPDLVNYLVEQSSSSSSPSLWSTQSLISSTSLHAKLLMDVLGKAVLLSKGEEGSATAAAAFEKHVFAVIKNTMKGGTTADGVFLKVSAVNALLRISDVKEVETRGEEASAITIPPLSVSALLVMTILASSDTDSTVRKIIFHRLVKCSNRVSISDVAAQ